MEVGLSTSNDRSELGRSKPVSSLINPTSCRKVGWKMDTSTYKVVGVPPKWMIDNNSIFSPKVRE